MRKTLYVARNELNSLFYSPIAWAMMVIFFIMTSVNYIHALGFFTSYWEWGASQLEFVKAVTSGIVSFAILGFVPNIIRGLYIFFPLITMGIISRELSSGSIKLLQSSPIRTREIVFGKFLAMAGFIGMLMALTLIIVLACALSIIHPDLKHIFISMAGLILVLLTYAAIGIFISSLTSYQIVAALLTLALFMYFNRADGLWKQIDWVHNVNYYLNMSGKAQQLIDTLVNLRDVTYFIVLIGGFLAFTIIKLKSSAEAIHWTKKALRYILVVLIGLILAYITSNPWVNCYYDGTSNKRLTLSENTQRIISQLNQSPLEITGYINLLDPFYGVYRPDNKNAVQTELWDKYIRFKPDIRIKYVYYYAGDAQTEVVKGFKGLTVDQVADSVARLNKRPLSEFLKVDDVSKMADVKAQQYHCFFELKYMGKTTVLRTFSNPKYPEEDEVAASLERLIIPVPKIAFLCDEIERSPFLSRNGDYGSVSSKWWYHHTLVSDGFDVDTLSLKAKASIPGSLAALVIADPRVRFSEENLKRIFRFIDSGGNLLITCEPDRKDVVRPILDKLGVSVLDGQILQHDSIFTADKVKPYLTDTAKRFTPQEARFFEDQIVYTGTEKFPLLMSGASGLRFHEKDGFKIDRLVYTDSLKSWNRVAPIEPDSLFLPVANVPGDQHGSFPTSIRLRRSIHGKEQNIIVSGDADYLSDQDYWSEGNYQYDIWSFSIFSNGQFPSNTLLAETHDNGLHVFQRDIPFQRVILYWIVPIVIAIMGIVLLIRRNRK